MGWTRIYNISQFSSIGGGKLTELKEKAVTCLADGKKCLVIILLERDIKYSIKRKDV